MTKAAFTIHGYAFGKRLGIESTQLSREKVFSAMGISHTIIFSDPFTSSANWVEQVEKVGVKNFKNLLLEHSSIALDKPSLSKEQALKLIDNPSEIKKIVYSKQGFVAVVSLENETIYFTSDIFMRAKENEIILYDKGANYKLLKEGIYWSIVYPDGSKKNNWQLITEWLATNSKKDDIFITDHSDELSSYIKRFFQNTGRTLYSMIHYNLLIPEMKFKFLRWCKLLVASEVLVERLQMLDIESQFLAPIFVENIIKREYKGIKDYCLVGSAISIKRVEMAINVFRKLEKENSDIRLTIYGGLPEGCEEKDLPSNITYAGFVEQVPYYKHEAYLSCSKSECFANSMVEAVANGLVCLVSDVDLAHRYYKTKDDSIILFKDEDDLLNEILIAFTKGGLISSNKTAERYELKKIIELYKEIFKIS